VLALAPWPWPRARGSISGPGAMAPWLPGWAAGPWARCACGSFIWRHIQRPAARQATSHQRKRGRVCGAARSALCAGVRVAKPMINMFMSCDNVSPLDKA
jgi:hypothetical protein